MRETLEKFKRKRILNVNKKYFPWILESTTTKIIKVVSITSVNEVQRCSMF